MADLYKRDTAYAHTSSGGDLQTVEGLDNLKVALLRRWFTSPGTYAYRPGYGAGVLDFRNMPMTVDNQRRIARRIEEQSMLDPRVEAVRSIAFSLNEDEASQVRVRVVVKPFGQSELTIIFDDLGEE